MKNHYYTYLLLIIVIGLLTGCAGNKQMMKTDSPPSGDESYSMPSRNALEHFLNALRFEEARYYQGALTEYQRALVFDPNSVELHMGAARNYYVLSMPDSAASEVQSVLTNDPDNVEALSYLGSLYIEKKKWEAALEVFKELSARFPEQPAYYAQLGAIYVAMNQPDEAVASYISIAKMNSNRNRVLERAASVMSVNEYFIQAIQLYTEALKYTPQDDGLFYSIGTAQLQNGETDSSIFYFRKAFEANPSEGQYALGLGYALNNSDDFAGAESVLKKGIETKPDDTRLYNLLGSVLQSQDKFDEALDVLFQSTKIDSNSVSPLITIGFIYDERGDYDNAVSVYDRAMAIDSTNALVLNNYAYLLAVAGKRLDEAKVMCEKAIELSPDNPSYIDTMGWIFYQLGEYEIAEDFIKRAMELDDNAVMYLHLGDIYRETGKMDKAVEIYRKGLERHPDNQELQRRMEVE